MTYIWGGTFADVNKSTPTASDIGKICIPVFPSNVPHLLNTPLGNYYKKTSQRWLSLNEGIKRAQAIIISWCVLKRKAKRCSNQRWAYRFFRMSARENNKCRGP